MRKIRLQRKALTHIKYQHNPNKNRDQRNIKDRALKQCKGCGCLTVLGERCEYCIGETQNDH